MNAWLTNILVDIFICMYISPCNGMLQGADLWVLRTIKREAGTDKITQSSDSPPTSQLILTVSTKVNVVFRAQSIKIKKEKRITRELKAEQHCSGRFRVLLYAQPSYNRMSQHTIRWRTPLQWRYKSLRFPLPQDILQFSKLHRSQVLVWIQSFEERIVLTHLEVLQFRIAIGVIKTEILE